MVAICIGLAIPAGIFVPSFVIGACGGRIIGELMVLLFPQGIRGNFLSIKYNFLFDLGPGGPQVIVVLSKNHINMRNLAFILYINEMERDLLNY